MFGTESVTVKVAGPSGEVDPFGAPITSTTSTVVSGVLVAPGPTSDLDASRPEGVSVVYTLHFPRGFALALRGATVNVRGTDYEVVGDPQPYTEANVPGPWTMPVEVRAVEG